MPQYRSISLAVLCMSSVLYTTASVATPSFLAQYFAAQDWHRIATLTGGIGFNSKAGTNHSFPAQGNILSFYNYDSSHATESHGYVGGMLGAERRVNKNWLMQLGLGYYQPSSFNASGHVTQGADSETANQYAYSYTIQSHQLLAEAKFLYNGCDSNLSHPYFTAGIGGAWNNSTDFSVNIVPQFTAFSNQFSNHSVGSFSYDLGLGMDVNFSQKTRLGFGYRFTDFGSASTGTSKIDDVQTTYALSQSHLYLNALIAQLSFDFF